MLIPERLEVTLQTWEDLCLEMQVGCASDQYAKRLGLPGIPGFPRMTGVLKHWPEFRQRLLHALDEDKRDLTHWLLPRPLDAAAEHFQVLLNYEMFPYELLGWTVGSRKSYGLEVELQEMLTSGTYPNIKWGDLVFPFPCFAVELARPLIHPSGEAYDSFLVAKTNFYADGSQYLLIRHFQTPQSLGAPWMYTEPQRKKIKDALNRRQWEKLMLFTARVADQMQGRSCQGRANISIRIPDPSAPFPANPDAIRAALSRYGATNEIDAALPTLVASYRIVAGICLYFEKLVRSSGAPSLWQPYPLPTRPGLLRAISTDAAVCKLLSSGVVDPTIFTGDREPPRSSSEKSPHKRRAHMRRPPGSAPNAPRTIYVPEVLVRGDRLSPGQLPGGSYTKLCSG